MAFIWATGPTPVPAAVAALTMPVLCIIGEEDIVFLPRYLEMAAAAIGGAQVVRIARAGHSVYFERATAFNEALDTFLSRGT